MAAVDIANLALGRLGIGQAISSLDETSTPARICKRFYDQCRREVLRSHPWSCVSTTQSIAQVADETYPGWGYVYQYPTNALMVWSVADEGGIRSWSGLYLLYCQGYGEQLFAYRRRYPFKVAMQSDQNSRVLLSDVPSAYAYITFDATNTNLFAADLTSAIADRLAMEVGGPLKVDANLVALAANRYSMSRSQAAAQEMNEQQDDSRPDADSIACRY